MKLTRLRLMPIVVMGACLLAMIQMAHAQTNLNDISLWDYENILGFGAGYQQYTSPVAGLFESTADGIQIATDSNRGAGVMVTKDLFSLAGTTVDFVWSGSGGSSFMEPVLGQLTTQWNTDSGRIENDTINASYGNSFNGSWVATPGAVYETQLNISSSNYTSVTTVMATGSVVGTQSGNFNFSVPLHMEFRQGDTYDNQNSYLSLKSLNIISSMPVPVTAPSINLFPAANSTAISTFAGSFLAQYGNQISPDSLASITTNANSTASLIGSNNYLKSIAQNESDALNTVGGYMGEVATLTDVAQQLSPGQKVLSLLVDATTDAITKTLLPNQVATASDQIRALDSLLDASARFATNPENAVSFAFSINSFLFTQVLSPAVGLFAHDPVDPNFQTIFIPTITVLSLPATGNAQLDTALQKQTSDLELASLYLGAVNSSFDKYAGAIAAGDNIHAVLQMEALLNYLHLYNQAAQSASGDIVATEKLLAVLGLAQGIYDPTVLTALQSQVASNGLPSDFSSMLTQIGMTSDQINGIDQR